MANLLTVAFIIFIAQASVGLKYDVHRRINCIKNRSRELYGEESVKGIKPLSYVNGDELYYPRRDKHKLALISHQWCAYYECLARLRGSLTASYRLPSAMLMVFAGAVARLHCNLCVAPDERPALRWTYAGSTGNLTFLPMTDKDRTVREEDGNITIYQVTAEDAGVYRCQVGRSLGGLVVLEVVDHEEYTVVKSSSSRGPYASSSITLNNSLTVLSAWSQWSECSVCGKVGRRRRYGLCYVQLYRPTIKSSSEKIEQIENEDHENILDDAILSLFEAFPSGIPCRSRHLPGVVRRIPAVLRRPSEIMIAMCKVKCKDSIFELRLETGDVLERANNTAGVYSLTQTLPKQPPPVARDTIFAEYGQPFVIRCPGTTLRDVPVSWRIGSKYAVARQLDKASGGRVHLDARDHLVITSVLTGDTNLYSCWQRDVVAGTVKLSVCETAHIHWNHHVTLALLVLLAAVALHVAERGLRNKRYGRT